MGGGREGPVQIMNMHGLPGHGYANKHRHTPLLDLDTPTPFEGAWPDEPQTIPSLAFPGA